MKVFTFLATSLVGLHATHHRDPDSCQEKCSSQCTDDAGFEDTVCFDNCWDDCPKHIVDPNDPDTTRSPGKSTVRLKNFRDDGFRKPRRFLTYLESFNIETKKSI